MIYVDKVLLAECEPPLREFILEYKRKAVFTTPLYIEADKRTTANKVYRVRVEDRRINPAFVVGTMHYDGDYVVFSERIQNERYASWRPDYNRKRSQDIKKAARTAATFLTPFKLTEIAKQHAGEVKSILRNWANHPISKIHEAVRYSISFEDLLEEVTWAVQNQHTFKNNKLNAAKGIFEHYNEEAKRREAADYSAIFVTTDEQGRYISEAWPVPLLEEQVPESIRSKISLLKLVDGDFSSDVNRNNVMKEVGVRTATNVFWVFVTAEERSAFTTNN